MGEHSKMKNPRQKPILYDQSCTRRAIPFYLLSLFACIIFQTVICASVIAAKRGEGGTLRLLYWQAPTIVNPHLSPGTKDWSASRIAYEPLASFDQDGHLIPFLAAEIPSLQNGGGDAAVAARAVLQDGLADFAFNMQVDAKTLAQLEAMGKGKIISPLMDYVERIMINFSDPNRETEDGERSSVQFPHSFFSDKRVRQALAYAIDRDAIARLYRLTGRLTTNLLVSTSTYNSPNTSYEFNLEKAAELLDKAGWVDSDGDGVREKDGVKLSLVFQTSVNSVRQQTQGIVKAALESVG
jgi:peptide/nickel transport system substrate-binding protein